MATACGGSECADKYDGDWVSTDGSGLYIYCECESGDTGDSAGGAGTATCYSSEDEPPTCFGTHLFGRVNLSTNPIELVNTDAGNPYSYTLSDDQRTALRETCGVE
ncbi:MAG: hypothetical protein FJ102_07625 [Deltaproteobacteria bacterium]|nr:hypothetical protein [Deltaproteobacteria bacterium]